MNAEQALENVDSLVLDKTGRHLKELESIILREFWEDRKRTYYNVAESYGYSETYLKSIGAELWQLFSGLLGEHVSKKNFKQALKRRLSSVPSEQPSHPQDSVTDNLNLTITPIAPTATNDIPDTSSEPLAVRVVEPHTQCNIPLNLPRRQYIKFIGRQTELKQLLKLISLDYRHPFITVDGIGGVGKTALVLEAAYLCLEASRSGKSPLNAPIFDAFIFTSAKQDVLWPTGIVSQLQRQSTLRDIFREISRTLDDQSIIQATAEDQLNRVYESLGRQRTLLIVDNMETVEDEEKDKVVAFLSNLPHSAKAVITTREHVPLFSPIRLNSLPKEESLQLIDQQASEKGVTLSQEESEELYNRFGGIPVALIYLIGQLASGYPLKRILERSVSLPEDIARFCFDGSVQPLREQPAHKLLMSVAIFSDAAVWDAVAEVAGLKMEPDKVDKGFVKLQRLSLVHQKEGRYGMLSLTREYVFTELAQNPEFEKEARERWVNWYLDFAQKYGGLDWDEYHIHYDYLDEEWGNLLAVLHWCAIQAPEYYEDVRDLWKNINDYADRYGYWDELRFWLDWLIEASQRRGEWSTAVYAMSEKIWNLVQMAGDDTLKVADQLSEEAWSLHSYANSRVLILLANYRAILCVRQKRYGEARHRLNVLEELVSNDRNIEERLRKRLLMNVLYYRAEIYFFECDYDRAKQLYEKDLQLAEDINWLVAIIFDWNSLANIAIKKGDLEEAETLLNTGLPVAERNKHFVLIANYQASFARLEKARGNTEKAWEWATKAKDGFQRLGMTEDSEEMRCLLDELK
ncbi:MAG: NB-ARC domain-containing protein [Hormoscilla sp.]